jgi:hypothetical protein
MRVRESKVWKWGTVMRVSGRTRLSLCDAMGGVKAQRCARGWVAIEQRS